MKAGCGAKRQPPLGDVMKLSQVYKLAAATPVQNHAPPSLLLSTTAHQSHVFTMSDLMNTNTGTASGQQLGTQDQAPAQTQAAGEKKDWLDKGITAAGKKLGFNIVSYLTALLWDGYNLIRVC